MDTSYKYRNMCKWAGEIIEVNKNHNCGIAGYEYGGEYFYKLDVLMEMKKRERGGDYLINQINWFCAWINEYIYDNKDAPTDIFGSMEQLWLAYIMYTDYGMVWRDNKWVKGGK